MSSAPASRDLANAIRALSMDAVQKANSGHPGAPMGMADIAEVLWRGFLKHNPQDPKWADRDRFVLSNGHGSMLLYSLLHLSGYGVSIEDIKNFRQLGSPTAGHPEYGDAPGIETTTGPLGQGIANAVGMALAEKMLAGQFNRDGHTIVDHNTYCFLGDGCMMEGISHEACSLAGTLGLGKLVAFYDDNGISIDGEVEGWFTDDTVERFRAYGWQVIPNVDGHDPEEIRTAIETAKATPDQPTLICCKTIIGFGSPNKQGKEECHGAALGDEEIALTREKLGWSHGPFEIPADIKSAWDACDAGAAAQRDQRGVAGFQRTLRENRRQTARAPERSVTSRQSLAASRRRANCRPILLKKPTLISASVRKRARKWPPVRPARTPWTPLVLCCRNWPVVLPTWPAPTTRSGKAASPSLPTMPAATTFTTVCVSSA